MFLAIGFGTTLVMLGLVTLYAPNQQLPVRGSAGEINTLGLAAFGIPLAMVGVAMGSWDLRTKQGKVAVFGGFAAILFNIGAIFLVFASAIGGGYAK